MGTEDVAPDFLFVAGEVDSPPGALPVRWRHAANRRGWRNHATNEMWRTDPIKIHDRNGVIDTPEDGLVWTFGKLHPADGRVWGHITGPGMTDFKLFPVGYEWGEILLGGCFGNPKPPTVAKAEVLKVKGVETLVITGTNLASVTAAVFWDGKKEVQIVFKREEYIILSDKRLNIPLSVLKKEALAKGNTLLIWNTIGHSAARKVTRK